MIVAVSPDIFGEQRIGGITRYAVELHREMREMGVDSRVFAAGHISDCLDGVPRVLGWRRARSRIPRLQRQLNELAFHGWCALQRGTLVVHRSFAGWRRRPSCTRLVSTAYDLIPELFPGQSPPSARTTRLRRIACESADAVCAISRTTAADLQRLWGIPVERIWITPLGVRKLEPSARQWRQEWGDYILYVGLRSGYKNAAALYEAFAASGLATTIRLLLFGGGPLTPVERAQLERLGIAGSVTQVEGGDRDLAACYRQALGYICPSRYEGFGLPCLESMVQGCPVASARAGSLPEVVGDAAISFDPDAIDDMAMALQALAEGRVAHAGLIARGHERACMFTWRRTAELTLMAYLGDRSAMKSR